LPAIRQAWRTWSGSSLCTSKRPVNRSHAGTDRQRLPFPLLARAGVDPVFGLKAQIAAINPGLANAANHRDARDEKFQRFPVSSRLRSFHARSIHALVTSACGRFWERVRSSWHSGEHPWAICCLQGKSSRLSVSESLWLAINHFWRNAAVRPLLLLRYPLNARPLKTVAPDADAIADGGIARLHEVEITFARIYDDCSGCLARTERHSLPGFGVVRPLLVRRGLSVSLAFDVCGVLNVYSHLLGHRHCSANTRRENRDCGGQHFAQHNTRWLGSRHPLYRLAPTPKKARLPLRLPPPAQTISPTSYQRL
jgi:hypothetical protein